MTEYHFSNGKLTGTSEAQKISVGEVPEEVLYYFSADGSFDALREGRGIWVPNMAYIAAQ